ncbi:sigma-70 family RNA polymerase sigma factor [Fodinisporobacter ferrooxydans]|uniref:Sigma-70 family RNA polymerase sigma factor n=1 Tax=Fodinisporobacter ferrooxydans TaxID=2901836 RepID=A0ABY4CQ07_9BACL|nr:sigma-70 family RNA polymerase sigma factor [Alicyclobacillaceae bacterium MYW30-H2]
MKAHTHVDTIAQSETHDDTHAYVPATDCSESNLASAKSPQTSGDAAQTTQTTQTTQTSQTSQASQTRDAVDWTALAAAVRAGDERKFAELAEMFRPLLRKMMGRFYRHAHMEDLWQEALIALYLAAVEYDPARGIAFPGYVDARVRFALWNFCTRTQRRESREVLPALAQDEENGMDAMLLLPCPLAEEYFHLIEMSEMFHSLSKRERLAVIRLVLERQKPGELALECHVSVETVKTWKKRALQKLRAWWRNL